MYVFLHISHSPLITGHKPDKVTFASDYFPELYQLAKQLISSSHAYVCHQSPDEVRGHQPPLSSWRDRPAEESTQLLEVHYYNITHYKILLRYQ